MGLSLTVRGKKERIVLRFDTAVIHFRFNQMIFLILQEMVIFVSLFLTAVPLNQQHNKT